MAKGDWWFKFEWNDWLTDEHLGLCSFETQGFWLRCICIMRRSGVSELTGSVDELRRLIGCLPEEVTRCAQELKRTKAADVIFGNGDVSIMSRRLQRELKAKEYNRLQVAKSRCKSDVSSASQDRVKSKSNKKEIREEEEKQADKPLARPQKKSNDQFLADLKTDPVYQHIDIDLELGRAKNWAAANNRQVTQKFFINWLNRIDKPMTGGNNNNATRQSEREKSGQRAIDNQQLIDDLRSGKLDGAVKQLFNRSGGDNQQKRLAG